MIRSFLATVLTAASLCSFAAPAFAQTATADEKELATYRLTMPTVRKLAAVFRSFAEEAARDPRAQEFARLREEQKTLEEKDELTSAEEARMERISERMAEIEGAREKNSMGGGNAGSLTEMEAEIRKQPAVMKALAREGLTPREYAKCFLALFQAALVQGFSQGKIDMAKLPAGINPENIKFVQENEKELEAIQKEMAAIGKEKEGGVHEMAPESRSDRK